MGQNLLFNAPPAETHSTYLAASCGFNRLPATQRVEQGHWQTREVTLFPWAIPVKRSAY